MAPSINPRLGGFAGRSRLIAATLLLSLFIGFLLLPSGAAQASTVTETFESYNVGTNPCQPTPIFTLPCTTNEGFAYNTNGGNIFVTDSVFDGTGSGKSLSHAGNAGSNFRAAGTDLCAAPVSIAIRGGVSASVTIVSWGGTVTGSTSFDHFVLNGNSITPGSPASATLAVTRYVNGVGTITGSTPALTYTNSFSSTTFYHFTIYCIASAAAGSATLVSPEALALGQGSVSVNLAANTGNGYVRSDKIFLNAPPSVTTYFDNIQTFTPETLTGAFCADHNILNFGGVAEADYGYDYRRGGEFFDQTDGDVPGIGLSTGFDYTGTDGTEAQFDYSAKHFTVGSKAIHENITIESAEGSPPIQSSFRVNFHTQLTTIADVTAKGNGLNTGHFADHLEAEFKALTANAWYITFWYVNAGGARTQIGGSHTFGDSLDATQFTVWIDTRADANAITTLNDHHGGDWYISGGGSLHADPFILVTTDSAADGPSGEEIAVIGIRYLDDIAGNPFLDDTLGDVWNVASGEIGVASSWHIALDEDNQEGRPNTDDEGGLDSTCIFDDAGTLVFANSPGATPGSQNPPPAPTPTPTITSPPLDGPAQDPGNPLGLMVSLLNDGWGFDWSWLIGAIIMGAVLWFTRNANVFVAAILTIITAVANIKLGLWEDWSLLLLVLACIAFAGNRLFEGKSSDGEAS